VTAVARAEAALARIEASAAERPEVWIHRRPPSEVLAEAAAVDRSATDGSAGPLAGWTVAVKDNIDVADVPTTAGCPAFAFVPDESAPVVTALRDAGAVIVGKTNMDQFATGLVGTRSPYGAVRNAVDPAFVAGGSSSGSAVAVALGLVDIALGTDTAGSGRVPAACNGIVGFKPTHGWLSTRGVVPACRSFDCVSVFARSVAVASEAVSVMAGYDEADVESRPLAAERARPVRTVGVVPGLTRELAPAAAAGYLAAVERVRELGFTLTDVDGSLFDDAGALLYGGGFVAERYAAVGRFVDDHLEACDPTVAGIISPAGHLPGHQLVEDRVALARFRRRAARLFLDVDAVLLPTVARVPRLDEVKADRLGVNTALGRYTYATNLLDLCAVAVPAGVGEHDLPFGVTFHGPAFADDAIAAVAASFLGEALAPTTTARLEPTWNAARRGRIAVAGAHLRGQPLNHQLTDRGAELEAVTTTAPAYRLYALATDPPKPGLVRSPADGAAIKVEVWRLPEVELARFVAAVPPPLAVGQIELADGSWILGFTCTPEPLAAGADITAFGGWLAYLEQAPVGR
jgi:allophanate hydrolase